MTDPSPPSSQIWGGRFAAGPSAIMQRINASIDFDKRLYAQDIAGSKAHCAMLVKTGILSAADGEAILAGLEQIRQEIAEGRFEFKQSLEDIHMNVEGRLADLIGDAAGRLHTARSRNDQVATDFKLWVRDTLDAMDKALRDLQAAQPISFGHHLLAYVEMAGRDRGRVQDARKRLNECPLGSAALAGTSYPIDRAMTANDLGFDRPCANSLDGVSDRDFALEFLSAAAIAAVHLSRLAEELVIWTTAQFGFVRLSDSYSTGSSIMPQKRNPDAAELVRAKAGRVIGDLNALLIVMKGLPLAYSKDMQDDKEPVFEAADTLELCLAAMTGMIADLTVDEARMAGAAGAGFTTATDIADWLVQKADIPFRLAHHITGRVVKLAESKGCGLEDLSLTDLQAIESRIGEDIFTRLSPAASAASRDSFGGTAPSRVAEAVRAAKERFL